MQCYLPPSLMVLFSDWISEDILIKKPQFDSLTRQRLGPNRATFFQNDWKRSRKWIFLKWWLVAGQLDNLAFKVKGGAVKFPICCYRNNDKNAALLQQEKLKIYINVSLHQLMLKNFKKKVKSFGAILLFESFHARGNISKWALPKDLSVSWIHILSCITPPHPTPPKR